VRVLTSLLHNKAHPTHPCVCFLLSIQTGSDLRILKVLLIRHHHVCLCCVVTGKERSCCRILAADLGSLRLMLMVLGLATVDAAVVHAVRYKRVLTNLDLSSASAKTRLNTCLSLARWQRDSRAHVLARR